MTLAWKSGAFGVSERYTNIGTNWTARQTAAPKGRQSETDSQQALEYKQKVYSGPAVKHEKGVN